MPAIKKLLFFKKITFILFLIWTIATTSFFFYQLHNEKQHILDNTIKRAKDTSIEAESLIKWAFERIETSPKSDKLQLKTDFSLRDLIYTMSEKKGEIVKIESNFLEDDLAHVEENIKKTIQTMQFSKKDQYSIYEHDNESYLFYIRPLLADKGCIRCHIHDDKKVGDLLGNFNLKMKIPTFYEYNKESFTFLLFAYTITWLLGIGVIFWIRHKNKSFFDEKMKNYEDSIFSLVDMMDRRDSYTAGHSKRVAQYASLIALHLNCSKQDVDLIYRAGMLHDIGKMEIPDALLLKPEQLTSSEYELIKTHSKFGYELLSREPFLELANIVLHHHERYDGNGYPYGLKKDEIPYFSQIISVADAFDAMTTNRAYRKSFSLKESLAILKKEKGHQFNPKIVDAALVVLNAVKIPENTTQMPTNRLDEMRFSYYFRDQLTGAYNVNYIKYMLAHRDDYKRICAHHVNSLHFSSYNKKYGWKNGDRLLQNIAQVFMQTYENSLIIRVFGDNFIILTLDNHIEIDKELLNPILNDMTISLEFNHIDLIKENITSVEELEDLILSYNKK